MESGNGEDFAKNYDWREIDSWTASVIETLYDAITYDIIGDAMAIHRARGRGYKEVTYQRDLEVRFKLMGQDFDPEPRLPVYDFSLGNQLVGFYIPDFIVRRL